MISERAPCSLLGFPQNCSPTQMCTVERAASCIHTRPSSLACSPVRSSVHAHMCVFGPMHCYNSCGSASIPQSRCSGVHPPRCPSVTTPTPMSHPGSLVTLNRSPSLYCCHFKNVTHVEPHGTGRVERAFLLQHPLRVSREESHCDGETTRVRCSASKGPDSLRCRLQTLAGIPTDVLGLLSHLCSVRGFPDAGEQSAWAQRRGAVLTQ